MIISVFPIRPLNYPETEQIIASIRCLHGNFHRRILIKKFLPHNFGFGREQYHLSKIVKYTLRETSSFSLNFYSEPAKIRRRRFSPLTRTSQFLIPWKDSSTASSRTCSKRSGVIVAGIYEQIRLWSPLQKWFWTSWRYNDWFHAVSRVLYVYHMGVPVMLIE